ncbi:MAG TPA: thioesterase family protein [Actinomycetota bacterium]|nr:thioesterase family protein [Actinomycetota bacterium]
MYERRIGIRWRDMDAYGHVNNAVYLTYLEECRDAWAQSVLGRVSDTWDFVLAHVGIDYRTQLTQDDGEVIVRCGLASYGRSSVRTREEIRTRDGTVRANAESVIVPRDPETLKARRLTDRETAILDEELSADGE